MKKAFVFPTFHDYGFTFLFSTDINFPVSVIKNKITAIKDRNYNL